MGHPLAPPVAEDARAKVTRDSLRALISRASPMLRWEEQWKEHAAAEELKEKQESERISVGKRAGDDGYEW